MFDPLAISLVIAANYAFDQLDKENKTTKLPKKPKPQPQPKKTKPSLEEADLPVFDEDEKELEEGKIKGIHGKYSLRNVQAPDAKYISKEEWELRAKRNTDGKDENK